MKIPGPTTATLFSALLVGLCLSLLTGCASSSSQNRAAYDRYAELVAERNRASKTSKKNESTSLNRRPLKSSSKSKSKKSTVTEKKSTSKSKKPAATTKKTVSKTEKPAATTKKTVAKTKPTPKAKPSAAEVPAAKPAPAPVPAPPVQVLAPPKPAPVPIPPVAAPVAEIPTRSGISAYTLKVGDGVQVFLRGIPSADAIEDVIDENGLISLPLINEIRAAGLTASDLERNIRKTYLDQDIYRNISVNVVVPARFYFIQGEVRGPGRVQIVTATRVSQAIAGAGGYTEYASGKVIIKRNGKIFKTIRNSRRLERTPEDDILLEPDDIVEVKRSMW